MAGRLRGVVGNWGARWQRHPDRIIEALAIGPGTTLADIGAGGGYFTFRFARASGPTGVVYAVEVNRRKAARLAARVGREAPTVQVVQPGPDDPALPVAVDLLFLSNTYHHLHDPSAYLRRAARYLRPGGRVAIVETNPGSWLTGLFGHATAPGTIRVEMAAAGFDLIASHDFLPTKSFLVFRPPSAAMSRPRP